ncbi:hypothetical protein LCGC14_1039830 [marine sediment metagenome]|uniref:Uncharacterized protein n=1 Tax=marine sediment metagenome TaxID=412755 RepID=A0A0F9MS44_9ZZZZ
MALSASDVQTRALTLKRFWQRRDLKMKDWYEQIKMVDTLAQKDMESFVGNDPRASYNLVLSILNQKIPHRLPPAKLDVDQVRPATELSDMFDVIWMEMQESYRLRGRHLIDDIIKYLLATGWYSVFAAPTMDGAAFIAEAWNPITVYPRWSDILSECAHVFTPGVAAIQHMALRNGWVIRSGLADNTIVYDYWWVERSVTALEVHNSIMVGSEQVKVDTAHEEFDRIPIFIFPIGGLPDTGELAKGRRGDEWKAEIGQSFIATNENVYRTVNKWWTYMLQLVRDTAQARTFEKSPSSTQIVKPEEWYQRGAHFKMGPQDDVGFITPPTIPVELRQVQLDLEAMEQRGGPSWTMFGSVQQRMTAYAMSQVVATTNQIAKPYHNGIIDLVTDIDNFFYRMIKKKKFRPYGIGLPENLPPGVRLTAEYELRIPGDLIQRATTARMLNPEFELSDERIMAELFPEIKNPTEELANVRAGKARKNPVYATISLVEALKQEAQLLREAGDHEGAELFEKAAERAEQELTGEGQQQQQQQQQQKVRVRPENAAPRQPRTGEVR